MIAVSTNWQFIYLTTILINQDDITNVLSLPYKQFYKQDKYSSDHQRVFPTAILLFLSIYSPLTCQLPCLYHYLDSKKLLL